MRVKVKSIEKNIDYVLGKGVLVLDYDMFFHKKMLKINMF